MSRIWKDGEGVIFKGNIVDKIWDGRGKLSFVVQVGYNRWNTVIVREEDVINGEVQ